MAGDLRKKRVLKMIPVTLQPEPADFDIRVRIPGRKWLNERGIALDSPLDQPGNLPVYWQKTSEPSNYGKPITAYVPTSVSFLHDHLGPIQQIISLPSRALPGWLTNGRTIVSAAWG